MRIVQKILRVSMWVVFRLWKSTRFDQAFLHGLETFWKMQNMYKLSQQQAEIYNSGGLGGRRGTYVDGNSNTNNNVSRNVLLRQIAKRQQQRGSDNNEIDESDENKGDSGDTTGEGLEEGDSNPFSQDITSATLQRHEPSQQLVEQSFEQEFEDS